MSRHFTPLVASDVEHAPSSNSVHCLRADNLLSGGFSVCLIALQSINQAPCANTTCHTTCSRSRMDSVLLLRKELNHILDLPYLHVLDLTRLLNRSIGPQAILFSSTDWPMCGCSLYWVRICYSLVDVEVRW